MIIWIAAAGGCFALGWYVWGIFFPRTIEIVGLEYNNRDTYTNYQTLVASTFYTDCLFIFNDNEKQTGYGGNASVRDFDNTMGIPTGKSSDTGGYNSFAEAKAGIDPAVEKIRKRIDTDTSIERVFYCCEHNGLIGLGIFKNSYQHNPDGQKILEYITQQIHDLGHEYSYYLKASGQAQNEWVYPSDRTKPLYLQAAETQITTNAVSTAAENGGLRNRSNVSQSK